MSQSALGGAILSAILLAGAVQASAAPIVVVGSGEFDQPPSLLGADGAVYAAAAGLTGHDTYSFRLVVSFDSPLTTVTSTTLTAASSDFSFELNGVTQISDSLAGSTGRVQETFNTGGDSFAVSFRRFDDIYPNIRGGEIESYIFAYRLPALTLPEDALPSDTSFLQDGSLQFIEYIDQSQANLVPRGGLASVDGQAVNFSISSPAPEPRAWTLLIVGFGAIGTVLRRSKTSRPISERRA